MSIPGHGVDPYTVFGLVLRATILLGIVGVAQRMLRARASAATRHLLWVSVLAALLVLPALGAALPRWPVAVRLAQWANEPPPVPAAAVPDPLTSMSSGVPATGPAAGATVAAERDRRSAAPSWPLLLFAGYLAGAGLLLARLGIHHAAAHRLIRRAEPIRDPAWTALLRTCADALGVAHPPRLRRSCEHSMPMASGIRRPVILLPDVAESWEPDRRRAVLLHELAHVARHDCVTQLLAELACAAYWFHPAVWWTARRLRIDRELACDDRVLAAGAEARSYAGHLLELAYTLGGRRGPALVVTMADRGQLEGRLLALLDAGRNRTSPGLRGQVASLALMTALVVPLARVDAAIVSLDEGAPVQAATSSLATDFPTAAGSAANDQQDAADGRAV